MTAEEYITQNFGESWLKNDWSSGDVIDALEEYAKYCSEIAFDDGFSLGFIDNQRPSFEEWWANFQRKEEAKSLDKVICPECLKVTTKEELHMFGGLCEDCTNECKD